MCFHGRGSCLSGRVGVKLIVLQLGLNLFSPIFLPKNHYAKPRDPSSSLIWTINLVGEVARIQSHTAHFPNSLPVFCSSELVRPCPHHHSSSMRISEGGGSTCHLLSFMSGRKRCQPPGHVHKQNRWPRSNVI